MRSSDREFLFQESGRRVESMLRRMGQVEEIVPWLQPGTSLSAMRRTAERLRSGAIRVIDPRISPQLLADIIEKSVAQELLVRLIAGEQLEFREMWRTVEEKEESERRRSFVAGFHELKKSPEASDPESPAAEEVRRIHRTRRNELGRPRRRRRADPD